MKKHILAIILFSTFALKAQITFFPYNVGQILVSKEGSLFCLDYTIKKSTCIVEGSIISNEGWYYVKEENQRYTTKLYKVRHPLLGVDISEGDTILIVLKTDFKGDVETISSRFSKLPNLYGDLRNNFQCLFFMDSDYPITSMPDSLKNYKRVTWITTGIGYFGASYVYNNPIFNGEYAHAVNINGLRFKTFKEWYDYLKKYPGVKVPEGY